MRQVAHTRTTRIPFFEPVARRPLQNTQVCPGLPARVQPASICGKLKDLGLLEPMTARFKLPSGKKAQFTGFMAIDRDKLKALAGDKLAELAKTGEFELMYVHLQSMRNFAGMVARVAGDKSDSGNSLEAAELPTEDALH